MRTPPRRWGPTRTHAWRAVTIVCLVLTLGVGHAEAQGARARGARVGEAAGSAMLGTLVGGLTGALIGGVTATSADPSSFAGIVGALVGLGVGAWIGLPSMIALAADRATQVGWAWLGHLLASVVGAGIALAGWATAQSERPFDTPLYVASVAIGGTVVTGGAVVAFALTLDAP